MADGIYPEKPQHAVPEPLPLAEFKSWHLPRKQWVRQMQWARTTAKLMEQLKIRDRPLRYLGLPGADLLDLEVLANICGDATVRFRYLGLNSATQLAAEATMQRIANNALHANGNIDGQSILLPDDFTALASKQSIAFSRLREFESFDVVNLDLCDAFTSLGGKPIHLALQNVIEYQTNARTQPWLLFITIAVDRRTIVEPELSKYGNLLSSNAHDAPEFGFQLGELIGDASVQPAQALSAATGEQLARLLVLAMGKWLHGVVCGQPSWTIELKSSVYYRWGIAGSQPSAGAMADGGLLSAVYGISRSNVPASDPSGISGVSPSAPADPVADERRAALQMAKKARGTFDLDCALQRDGNLRDILTREAAQMLAARNYNEAKYMEFAASVLKLKC
ncbi:MAG: hypothetical protein K1X67_26810 [Fimbriimonadaceae bacterium]|nr:hypothetical protein [Fimbriimonadaceae bacterium]